MYQELMNDPHAYWQKRAATFGSKCGTNAYAMRFMELLGLGEGQSVLDMGCATGTLAVPLAKKGHAVIACDFSSNMLEGLSERAAENGVFVSTKLMAWEDDWEACGVAENCVDVAIASRSISAGDFDSRVAKLERVARSKVAITVPGGALPSFDPSLCEHLGRYETFEPPHLGVLRSLADAGRFPVLDWITCERPMRSESREWVEFELRKLAGREPLSAKEEQLFAEYADEHIRLVDKEGEALYALDYALTVNWAFIMWGC